MSGAAGFGTDDVPTPPAYVPADPPRAVYFQPRIGDFLLDPSGRYRELDPIDLDVILAFSTPRGSLLHAPEVGHDYLSLRPLWGAALDAEITRLASLATPFDKLLAAGKVFLLGVTAFHPKNTESDIVIQYSKIGNTQPLEVAVVTR